MARVRLARARAHLAQGRDDLAESDLSAGIELFERQRAAVADEALRSASFEQPWDLYSEMIRLQAVSRRQPGRALTFAERARARTLLEALSPAGGTAPLDPGVARANLPSSVLLIYYAALDDRLLIWTMSSTTLTFLDTPVRHAELVHLVQQYRSEMESSGIAPRDTPSLTVLYDRLIRPIAGHIPHGADLVIIPDGVLHAVPFAALIRREDRRYVIEEHPVQVAPSLTMLLASRKPASRTDATTAFVVGNPRTEGADSGELANLPEAETEAREVAALYPHSALAMGPNATKSEFLKSAGHHEVIHFAGHAIANEADPELSRLVLAGQNASARSLFAREIAAESFPATRLVVLGACRTSAGRIRRGEGVFSLARPFLAAGVPAVVASLWDVNDRATRRLLVAFHGRVRESRRVTDALREAQLELMGDSDPLFHSPAGWAGFTVIDGLSDRRATDSLSVQ
jgi:CHAT domain-containing protein